MRGQQAFANFVQFLQQSPDTCGFIYQAQLITADQRKNFSYRDTPAAKEVTAWLTSNEGRVAGNSAHKERLRTLATSGSPFDDPWPHGVRAVATSGQTTRETRRTNDNMSTQDLSMSA